jgi:hypothetical protein
MTTDIITMDGEWGGLRFWPTSLEEATARLWPVLLIAPLVIEITLAWWINGKTGTRWRYDFGTWYQLDPVLISLVCALALSAVCFRNWMTSVQRLFPSLYKQGSLGGPTDATFAQFRRSAETYQDWLHHPIRYALIGLVLLFTSVAMVRFNALSDAVEAHFGAGRSTAADWAFTVLSFGVVATMLLWSYAVGAAAWCLIVTGVYVSRLPATFPMRIKLGHPDKCGGLRGLGSCCLGIATPILIGVGLLGLWIVLAGTASWSVIALTTFKSTVELALIAIIPIAIVAFLAPLWSIHTFMSRQREALIGELGRDLDDALRRIKNASATASDADLKSFSDRATALKQLDPDVVGMREWPFDTQLLVKFAATPVASGVGAILKNIHW